MSKGVDEAEVLAQYEIAFWGGMNPGIDQFPKEFRKKLELLDERLTEATVEWSEALDKWLESRDHIRGLNALESKLQTVVIDRRKCIYKVPDHLTTRMDRELNRKVHRRIIGALMSSQRGDEFVARLLNLFGDWPEELAAEYSQRFAPHSFFLTAIPDVEPQTGGQSTVVRCKDLLSGTDVAVKVAHPGLENSYRIKNEAKVLRRLAEQQIRGVPTLVSQGHSLRLNRMKVPSDSAWLAMQYIVGKTLANTVKEAVNTPGYGKRRDRRFFKMIMGLISIAEVVKSAHQAGLLHLDLKPQNIIRSEKNENRWYVLDWGLSLVTTQDDELAGRGEVLQGAVYGTIGFSPPEQLHGDRQGAQTVSEKSDVFSLGAVLYFVCTGLSPAQCVTEQEFRRLRRSLDPKGARMAWKERWQRWILRRADAYIISNLSDAGAVKLIKEMAESRSKRSQKSISQWKENQSGILTILRHVDLWRATSVAKHSMDRELRKIVSRAMLADPKDRPTLDEFIRQLSRWALPRKSIWMRMQSQVKRVFRWGWMQVTAVVVSASLITAVIASGAVLGFWRYRADLNNELIRKIQMLEPVLRRVEPADQTSQDLMADVKLVPIIEEYIADVRRVERPSWYDLQLKRLESYAPWIAEWKICPRFRETQMTYAQTLRLAAEAYERLGRYSEAERVWQQAIAELSSETFPKASGLAELLFRRAQVLETLGRFSQAEDEYALAKEKAGDDLGLQGRASGFLADLQLFEGRLTEATSNFDAARTARGQLEASSPNDRGKLADECNIARLLGAQGKWSEATEKFETVLTKYDDLLETLRSSPPRSIGDTYEEVLFERCWARWELADVVSRLAEPVNIDVSKKWFLAAQADAQEAMRFVRTYRWREKAIEIRLGLLELQIRHHPDRPEPTKTELDGLIEDIRQLRTVWSPEDSNGELSSDLPTFRGRLMDARAQLLRAVCLWREKNNDASRQNCSEALDILLRSEDLSESSPHFDLIALRFQAVALAREIGINLQRLAEKDGSDARRIAALNDVAPGLLRRELLWIVAEIDANQSAAPSEGAADKSE